MKKFICFVSFFVGLVLFFSSCKEDVPPNDNDSGAKLIFKFDFDENQRIYAISYSQLEAEVIQINDSLFLTFDLQPNIHCDTCTFIYNR